MKVSAGLVLLDRDRMLLCHPTNAPWLGTYGIPKGLVEPGEDLVDAAIRETREEVGVVVPPDRVGPGGVVPYVDKRGRLFKRLHWFVASVEGLDLPGVIPRERLQLAEVDWAGFLDRAQARPKLFHRFLPLLDLLPPSETLPLDPETT